MHAATTVLDSSLVYLICGFLCLCASTLLRRARSNYSTPETGNGRDAGIPVRIRSTKVVSIDRNRRVPRHGALPVRHAGNY